MNYKNIQLVASITLLSSTFGIFCAITEYNANIGFPNGFSPTPATSACLDDQEVYGYTGVIIFRGSAIEPVIAINPADPAQLICIWEQDKGDIQGALEVGIGHSENGGRFWNLTTIPLQICVGGINQTVSEPHVVYAADGSVVYLIAEVFNITVDNNSPNQSGMVVCTSRNNGKTWSAPVYIASSPLYINALTVFAPYVDNPFITVDPNNINYAYGVWLQFPPIDVPLTSEFHGDTWASITSDKGATWGASQLIYDPFPDLTAQGLSNGIYENCQTIVNEIVVLPNIPGSSFANGDQLLFMVRIFATPGATDMDYVNDSFPYQYTINDIAVVRSSDHGQTWTTSSTEITSPWQFNENFFSGGWTLDTMGNITGGIGDELRCGAYTAQYKVNSQNGYLYAVWPDTRFRADQLPQIALSTSRDGGFTWTSEVQINRTPQNCPNPQAFSCNVAVANGYVGVFYQDLRNDPKTDLNNTLTDAWLDIYKEVSDPTGGSTGIGLDFVTEVRLSANSYIQQNGPFSGGYMTSGDYSFLTSLGNTFYATFQQSLNGPFSPATLFYDDPANEAQVYLDNNYRTAPFLNIVSMGQ